MELVNLLTSAEKKRMRNGVSSHLEKYRLLKSILSFDTVCEDKQKKYHDFCRRVERAVEELPGQEKLLITERYLQPESDYISDLTVYQERFNPPISHVTYTKIRDRGMYKLLYLIGIECEGF